MESSSEEQLWARCAHLRPLTNDDTFASQLVSEIDLVARRALDELDVWELVADLDTGRCRRVEEATAGERASQWQAAGCSKHDGTGGGSILGSCVGGKLLCAMLHPGPR